MKKNILILIFSGFIFPAFSQQNPTIFLKFNDNTFKGESDLIGFESSIPALSVSYGVSNVVVTSGGGSGAGKAKFTDFNFLHTGSLNSPIFNLYVANGKRIPKVEISFIRNSSERAVVVYKVTLEGVGITSVSTATNADCNNCSIGVESISLSYTKITWEDLQNNVKASWDISKNSSN